MPQRKATGWETPELPPTSHPWRARRSTGHQYPPLFLISSYEESNCISCPRSPVRLGEIARPRRCWQSCNVSGAETWKDSEVGDKDFTPNQQKKPAGSGEKDPICACIMWPSIYCSVYTNITRLFLSNKWVGFVKKKIVTNLTKMGDARGIMVPTPYLEFKSPLASVTNLGPLALGTRWRQPQNEQCSLFFFFWNFL